MTIIWMENLKTTFNREILKAILTLCFPRVPSGESVSGKNQLNACKIILQVIVYQIWNVHWISWLIGLRNTKSLTYPNSWCCNHCRRLRWCTSNHRWSGTGPSQRIRCCWGHRWQRSCNWIRTELNTSSQEDFPWYIPHRTSHEPIHISQTSSRLRRERPRWGPKQDGTSC